MHARTIHTERLDLTPWAPGHTAALAQLARTPGAVPSIARDPRWDPAHPEVLSRTILHHWEAHGFGWRTISERAVGAITGFSGVSYLGQNDLGLDPGDFEFVCWVHPSHWRRGLAAEASVAVIDEAFAELGAGSVVGLARADHRASINGAQSLGFAIADRITAPSGTDVVLMRVTADEWAAAHRQTAGR